MNAKVRSVANNSFCYAAYYKAVLLYRQADVPYFFAFDTMALSSYKNFDFIKN